MSSHQIRQLSAATILMLLYGIPNGSFGLFLEPVTTALGCSRAAFNLCFSIISTVSIFTVSGVTHLFDRISTRRVLLCGGMAGTLGFTIFSFSTQIYSFYIGSFLIGIFLQGCTSVAAVLIVNKAFPVHSGTPTGISMAGSGISIMLASLILPPVIEAVGWQFSYRILAVVWLLLSALAGFLSEDLSKEKQKKEVRSETNIETGATYSQALHSPYLYGFLLAIMVLYLNTIFFQHLPAFFQEIGYTAVQAGHLMAIYSVSLIFCKIFLGVMYDHLGATRTILLIFSGFAVSLWLFLTNNHILLMVGLILIAFGMASGLVLMPLLAREIFGSKDFSRIWGTITIGSLIGCAAGAPLWGFIYDSLGSYHLAVLIAPFIILANALFLLFLVRYSPRIPWNKRK